MPREWSPWTMRRSLARSRSRVRVPAQLPTAQVTDGAATGVRTGPVRRWEGSAKDLGHVRRDGPLAECAGGCDPVVAVGDVVAALEPVGLDGRQRHPLTQRADQSFEARAAPLVGGQEVAVELG